MVERLPSKRETLNQTPVLQKKKKVVISCRDKSFRISLFQ
jgi:hypothetical protein